MNKSFSFNTIEDFDLHIRNSIPDYENLTDMILKISDFFITSNTYIYDLGTSTGSFLSQLKDKVEFALAPNKNPSVSGYYNVWIHLKNINNKIAFTNSFKKNEILTLPMAHGEGRFVTKDKALIKKLQKNNQIIFKYCNKEGKIEDKFPEHPNGSMLNIAALSNARGNVMAIMPHPERAIWQRQVPNIRKTDKLTNNIKIFESMKKYIQDRK